jgi:DNA-directed RNA polymerase specialized sigma subunit, sigma24 homolog
MAVFIAHWNAELFRNHHRDMVSRAARIVGERNAREDVVRTAYVKLVANARPACAISNPRAHTITALRRKAFDLRPSAIANDCTGLISQGRKLSSDSFSGMGIHCA